MVISQQKMRCKQCQDVINKLDELDDHNPKEAIYVNNLGDFKAHDSVHIYNCECHSCKTQDKYYVLLHHENK